MTQKNSIIKWRPYQRDAFLDRRTGVDIWFWARQIGKSFTGAGWSVDRLLTRPGRLVTVLSNSRDNGAELNLKCAEVCRLLDLAHEQEDLSPDYNYENMNMETRIEVAGRVGRIKVLAANPRTARGFSGDLILDEFAFHEDSYGIWEAAEPILSSNPDFLCRIMSTPNGTHNMFFAMVTSGLYNVRKVRRSDAYSQGLKIYHPVTREEITPEQARSLSLDKRAYDQNYELLWADENTTLLTHDLINAAEDNHVGVICDGAWSDAAIALMHSAVGPLFVGVDVGRKKDLTVISVAEQLGLLKLVRGVLRLRNMRLPQQQRHLEIALDAPNFRRAEMDLTGIGLGLCEYTQEKYGPYKVRGVNFASTVPITQRLMSDGRKQPTVRITEAMATDLLGEYEDRAIKHPCDLEMRDDLRKPEKTVSPGGSVSIAATSDEAGHADHFWSFALMNRAAGSAAGPFQRQRIERKGRIIIPRTTGVLL
ncbi:MAG: terminase family protein [Kiritimatiellae bacterium]|nr:terminase family protein [Kiritimatiellia bacterium]